MAANITKETLGVQAVPAQDSAGAYFTFKCGIGQSEARP